VDVLAKFEDDAETECVVMVGEIGGAEEEKAAAFIESEMTKPVVAYIAGFTAPPGKTMGHAGAIISGTAGTAQAKKEALEAHGVRVGTNPNEVARLVAARAIDGRLRERVLDALERPEGIALLEEPGLQDRLVLLKGGLFGTTGSAAVAAAGIVARYVHAAAALALIAWFSPLLAAFVAAYVGGWTGLWAAPGLAVVWVAFLAVGLGAFAMVLVLFGMRARTAQSTAALSTAVQGWGYVLGSVGPLLVGVVLGLTGSFVGLFVVALVAAAGMLASGWLVTRERYVDDEVRAPVAASPRG
jgi:hypothetical protein